MKISALFIALSFPPYYRRIQTWICIRSGASQRFLQWFLSLSLSFPNTFWHFCTSGGKKSQCRDKSPDTFSSLSAESWRPPILPPLSTAHAPEASARLQYNEEELACNVRKHQNCIKLMTLCLSSCCLHVWSPPDCSAPRFYQAMFRCCPDLLD